MIGKKQEQNVDANSVAIQSGGDTVINNGLSEENIRSIIETVADQIPKYAAIAGAIVDQRLKDFEEKIINRFESDKDSNTDAFKDPDFQYLLGRAQHGYARSGFDQVGDSLAELISERSKAPVQSRLALTLNGAVERAALLTREEFAELSFSFFLRRVVFTNIKHIVDISHNITEYILPLIKDISVKESSYTYLESVGCGKLSMAEIDFASAILQKYPKALLNTKQLSDAVEVSSEIYCSQLIDAGLLRLDAKTQVVDAPFETIESFVEAIENCAIETSDAKAVWTAIQGTPMSPIQVKSSLIDIFSELEKVFDAWDSSPMKHFEPSAVGLVIGFSNLSRISKFKADLSIWID